MTDDPRRIDPSAFPATGSARAKLRFLLRYAVLAPSGHNTQPWLFELTDDSVEVIADRTRALPVVDPHDRALVISCGAAVQMTAAAARAYGFACDVIPFPAGEADAVVARIGLGREGPPGQADLELREAILRRVTDRRAFGSEAVSSEARADMQRACVPFGVDLHLVDDPTTRHALAELVAEGDRIQFADPRFRRELAHWVRPRRTGDGLSFAGSEWTDELAPVSAFVVRTFDLGGRQAAKDRDLARHSPLLAVFSSPTDAPEDWLATGRALAAASLVATRRGLSASYLNQPIEVSAVRPRLAQLVCPGRAPQLLLRFGAPPVGAPPPRPSARRPLDEVVVVGRRAEAAPEGPDQRE
jgi:hypothetical protein